ncbi:MAG: HD domain-containing protein [Candidatus Nanoarchaeia archaeon]|nr:HD domain-containing protein [Candidatus Nanoarchaeia archaeon]
MDEYYFKVLKKIGETIRYKKRPKIFHQLLSTHIYNCIELAELYHSKYNLNLDIIVSKNIVQNHDIGEYLEGDHDAKKILDGEISQHQKELDEKRGWDSLESILPAEVYALKRNYWEMFEYNSNKEFLTESLYAKVIDKLEAMIYMSTKPAKAFKKKSFFNPKGFSLKDYEMSATYGDECFKKFIAEMNKKTGNNWDLKGFISLINNVKSDYKKIYEKVGAPWKEEYNYGMK